MSADLHTMIDIFDADFMVGGETVRLQKIVIPKIQRDYAQGRTDPEIVRIRSRFLDALYQAVTGRPITLDFVYGDINRDGVLIPLDGQQRLTTLFLLHWYAAKKENVPQSEYAFLERFSYETRPSAREFCVQLVKYEPDLMARLSEGIVDQRWFPLDWKKDPTISSMLVMLDAIQEKFVGLDGIWGRLKDGAISFYFLPVKDMGLTDELYIKMNSRGKPLTQFEHFKAELERSLKEYDEGEARRISEKIDRDWTDLLWRYRGADNITDDEFLRYFKFVCDVICYQKGDTPQGKSRDEFDLIHAYFSPTSENISGHIKTLEAYFDCWCRLSEKEAPLDFLGRFISHAHEPGKIQIDTRYEIDIFKDCLHTYADTSGRNRQFPLNRIVLLYTVIAYLLHQDTVSEAQFARRLRIVNNLIQNSEYEISDSTSRTSGNRIPAILAQVDNIMMTGRIDEKIERSFNQYQLTEEAAKIDWVEEHPGDAERLYTLEDHPLLQGQIAILGLENAALFESFAKLFQCNWDKVDCALMATGFYPQRERNGWRRGWRYQFGTSSRGNQTAWRNLFHKSSNAGFDETGRILSALLLKCVSFTDAELLQISSQYIRDCDAVRQYPFRYYYIKYPSFRPASYGKYYNETENQYLFCAMQTQLHLSANSYIPWLKEADAAHLSKDDLGQRLAFGDTHLVCKSNGYVLRRTEDYTEIERIVIPQDSYGVDTEDRIVKLKEYLSDKTFQN